MYHKLYRHRTPKTCAANILQSVKTYGLLSARELAKRELSETTLDDTEKFSKHMLPNHFDTIYFQPLENPQDFENLIGIEIDPKTTYCYNERFRTSDHKNYERSKILVEEYLSRFHKKSSISKDMTTEDKEEKVIILHPLTAQPTLLLKKIFCVPRVGRKESLGADSIHWERSDYFPEVTFITPYIPAEQLIFFDKQGNPYRLPKQP